MMAHMVSQTGPYIASEADAGALLSEAWATDAQVLVIPIERFSDDFFRLTTGILGGFAQKFENYHMPLIILGDVSSWCEASAPFRDYVRETNSRSSLCFVPDEAALKEKLNAQNK